MEIDSPRDCSPDEDLGTEVFEQADEARGERESLSPGFEERSASDPSMDPALELDEREVQEVGAEWDDPEKMAIVGMGADDPDGVGWQPKQSDVEAQEWDLDASGGSGDGSGSEASEG